MGPAALATRLLRCTSSAIVTCLRNQRDCTSVRGLHVAAKRRERPRSPRHQTPTAPHNGATDVNPDIDWMDSTRAKFPERWKRPVAPNVERPVRLCRCGRRACPHCANLRRKSLRTALAPSVHAFQPQNFPNRGITGSLGGGSRP